MTEPRTPVVRATLPIVNRLGLHARAAAAFVQTASPLDCDVSVTKDDVTVNGKSIMGLMMLAAAMGSAIDVECSGPQAEEALAALAALVANRFNESE